ncbi:MAG: hypothetical protein AMXMBFR61_07410 [Fimbriimonadales bacterium]
MIRLLARLDRLDRRWLYLTLVVAVAFPLFVDVKLPSRMGHEARGLYDAIERLDSKSIVLVHSDWDAGTLGELKGQFTAIIAHLFRNNIKFAVISAIPQGPAFSDEVVDRLAAKYGKKYLEDWVQLGYRIPTSNISQGIQSLSKDFRGTAPTEIRENRDIRTIPWMAKVSNCGDFDLLVSVSYAPYLEYIQFGYEVYGTPYVAGVCSISTTNMYPLMDAGQLKGMLVGARGGAEYEGIMGLPEYDAQMKAAERERKTRWSDLSYATKVIKSQSWAHLLLILGAIAGNIGAWARMKEEGKKGK